MITEPVDPDSHPGDRRAGYELTVGNMGRAANWLKHRLDGQDLSAEIITAGHQSSKLTRADVFLALG